MMAAACRLVRRAVASLGVWLLPIVVGALTVAALSGKPSFHGGSGPQPERDKTVVDGEQPFSIVELYYSAGYVEVVKKAHEQGRDILASIQTLESAWTAASPASPLAIRLVSSAPPETVAANTAFPTLRATAMIDETSFREMRPILEDIRDLILEGDGDGCGRLRRSAYQAQPADGDENFWAGSSAAKSGVINSGPAKVAPHPESTL